MFNVQYSMQALTRVSVSEVVDWVGSVDVIHSECLLKDIQRSFILCNCVLVLALKIVTAPEVVVS